MFKTASFGKMGWIASASLLLVTATFSASVNADSAQHGVGLYTNGFGLGAAYTYKLNDRYQIRGALSGGEFEEVDTEFSSLEYDGDYDSSSVGVMLDWYPMSKGWKRNMFFSFGLMSVESEFKGDLESLVGGDVSIGGTVVNSQDIGGAELTIEHDQQFTPYVGIGFGNRIDERRLSFYAELGLIHLKDPDVSLVVDDPDGLVSQASVRSEINDIADEESGITGFASFGVNYHF